MTGYSDLFTPPAAGEYTEALRKTYLWIEAFIGTHGYAPTVDEIATGLTLSYGGAYSRLRAMSGLHWIRRSGRKRDITLLGMKE